MPWRERLRALRMDVTPLRDFRDFRLLFVAGTVLRFGAMVSYVAMPYQVHTLTGSSSAVGGFACLAGVGLTALALSDFWSDDARTDEYALAERAVRASAGERHA